MEREMDNIRSCYQKTLLISELIQGKELTEQLMHNLNPKCSPESRHFLMQQIICIYEKALLILQSNTGSVGVKPTQTLTVTTSFPNSPISVDGSPHNDDFDGALQNRYKKRKVLPRWTTQVRIGSENGLEVPFDDGYNWRKYGQKNILGAKYPRSYYRCTFLKTQRCLATKQVQRSDADPSVYDITYRGIHTCTQVCTNSVQTPPSPDNQEQKPSNHYNIPNQQQQQQQQFEESIQGFPNNWKLEVEIVEPKDKLETLFSFPSTSYECMKGEDRFSTMVFDNESLLGSSCESLISPATPEPNNNMFSPFEMNYGVEGSHKMHCSASNLTEIISANTSTTNSSVSQFDFCIDPIDDVSYFPFDISGFFT